MKTPPSLVLFTLVLLPHTLPATAEAVPPKDQWTISASASENKYIQEDLAIDGDPATRWGSPFEDGHWIQIDLGATRTLTGVEILWESAYSRAYSVAVATDTSDWNRVFRTDSANGGLDLVVFPPQPARYVRIHCLERATGWGNSIYEVDILGEDRQVTLRAEPPAGTPAARAWDGDPQTAWTAPADAREAVLAIDLATPRRTTGLRVDWGEGYPGRARLMTSEDGEDWNRAGELLRGRGGFDLFMHPEQTARHLRLVLRDPQPAGRGFSIRELQLRGPGEDPTPLRRYELAAAKAPAGWYPDVLREQQVYWTVSGLPAHPSESLLDEFGSLEPFAGAPRLMPLLEIDGDLLTHHDMKKITPALADGALPLPATRWENDRLALDVETLTADLADRAVTLTRYRLTNRGDTPLRGALHLLLRPLQVNPRWQHGGFAPLHHVGRADLPPWTALQWNDGPRLFLSPAPDTFGAVPFVQGDIVEALAENAPPVNADARSPRGMLSAGAAYPLDLAPGGNRTVCVAAPLPPHERTWTPEALAPSDFPRHRDRTLARWRQRFADFPLALGKQDVADTIQAQIGYIFVNQDGDAIQPGSRNYNRAWMRDGCISISSLLKMNMTPEAREYVNWYAARVETNGHVPPILNTDGSVYHGFGSNLEYDSQGQFVFAVMEVYRFTRDRAFLQRHFPTLVRALEFLQQLRERTLAPDYQSDEPHRERYIGILPASISHEGYSTPHHSYWDNYWALKGWRDGAEAARLLNRPRIARWAMAEHDKLYDALGTSIRATMAAHDIDFIPGSAEKGDPDINSLSIAFAPCGVSPDLFPEGALDAMYDEYLRQVEARLEPGWGGRYTPYEVRNILALIDLGRPGDARTLHDLLFRDRRPPEWRHFAEVVLGHERMGSYIGDMPHTWVGAGYVSAARGMLVREDGDSLHLFPATPEAWLADPGVRLTGLPTTFGPLTLTAVLQDRTLTADIDAQSIRADTLRLHWPPRGVPDSLTLNGKSVPPGPGGLDLPPGLHTLRAHWTPPTTSNQ